MKFAKIVFIIAGIWGIVVLAPLYFLFDIAGHAYPPPATYPHFFYGFLSVTFAWQIAFLVIGSDPARFRPLMIASVLEKLGYIATVSVLYRQARISANDASTAAPDVLLAILFVAAFVTTRPPGKRGI
jgi:hypothetical protein